MRLHTHLHLLLPTILRLLPRILAHPNPSTPSPLLSLSKRTPQQWTPDEDDLEDLEYRRAQSCEKCMMHCLTPEEMGQDLSADQCVQICTDLLRGHAKETLEVGRRTKRLRKEAEAELSWIATNWICKVGDVPSGVVEKEKARWNFGELVGRVVGRLRGVKTRPLGGGGGGGGLGAGVWVPEMVLPWK
ncbi:MAG: hypothetical protein M1816_002751 [Peltula sp. TS41687]|nr:MAG: hypothetical protein M1816_002751 [Peltula sp. TS41687]